MPTSHIPLVVNTSSSSSDIPDFMMLNNNIDPQQLAEYVQIKISNMHIEYYMNTMFVCHISFYSSMFSVNFFSRVVN
jgi:hypothetical protein